MSIPEVFFRETIDLNRYSNSVAKKYAVTYNEVILNAAKQLRDIELRQRRAGEAVVIAPQTRKRLRAIIKQAKDSLNTWSGATARDFKKELQGITLLQRDFIVNELKKVTASGDVPINSVAISPKYADSFISTDPTQTNIFTSKQFTEDDFVKFGAGKFELTARQGAAVTLPNGQTVEKAFRGIAASSQEKLALAMFKSASITSTKGTITFNDQGFDRYKKSVDLIKKYIFPGSCLISINQITEVIKEKTDLNIVNFEDITAHYAETLKRWRLNFLKSIDQVKKLGFSESFINLWEFYFIYCEAGFVERHIGDVQIVFAKSGARDINIRF